MPLRLLFVCMGNICRSPTAEGVMRNLLAERGRDEERVERVHRGVRVPAMQSLHAW